jgi:hypothetical protein
MCVPRKIRAVTETGLSFFQPSRWEFVYSSRMRLCEMFIGVSWGRYPCGGPTVDSRTAVSKPTNEPHAVAEI